MMLRLLIRIGLLLLVLNQLLTPAAAFRNSGGRGGGKYAKGYNDPSKPKNFVGTSAGLPAQNGTRRGLGISAWGIIVLIVAIALTGVGFYYFSMCYPIICQKNKKYDMMGLPSMA